jgi:phosphoglycerol transferase MdoB-like AlkP superfamily enzyme
MTPIFLLDLIIGFIAMALVFLLAAKGFTQRNKWLGLAAIAVSAPFFYWLGAFSEQFTSGQCYTRSIEMIANAVAKTDSAAELSEKLRSLPLYGYETVCSDVEAASERLPNASAR